MGKKGAREENLETECEKGRETDFSIEVDQVPEVEVEQGSN